VIEHCSVNFLENAPAPVDITSRTGLVVSVPGCGMRGSRFESHRGHLCLS